MYDYNIPPHTRESLRRYADDGVPTGGFLYAVLTNKLFEAVGRADSENSLALRDIAMYIYNELPAASWGSEEAVHNWIQRKIKERAAQ